MLDMRHIFNISNSIMNVRHPANYLCYDHPFFSPQESSYVTSSPLSLAQNLSSSLSYSLLHHRIHCTHVALCILEFLNQAKVALLVFLSNHLSVRFLDFLQTNLISANYQRRRRSGAYLNLLLNVLSI